jgi:hypothetical protein
MWPIQLAFLIFIACRIFLSSLTLCNTSSFLTRLVKMFFSILLQHRISNLSRYFWSTLPVSMFQYHTGLRSKCSTLIVSSLNLNSVCWWKYSTSYWMLLFCDSPRFNFTCTYCIIRLVYIRIYLLYMHTRGIDTLFSPARHNYSHILCKSRPTNFSLSLSPMGQKLPSKFWSSNARSSLWVA